MFTKTDNEQGATLIKGGGQKSWYSQAFEKPGQARATRPPNLSFVSPNPVTIHYLPFNITWASGGPSPAK